MSKRAVLFLQEGIEADGCHASSWGKQWQTCYFWFETGPFVKQCLTKCCRGIVDYNCDKNLNPKCRHKYQKAQTRTESRTLYCLTRTVGLLNADVCSRNYLNTLEQALELYLSRLVIFPQCPLDLIVPSAEFSNSPNNEQHNAWRDTLQLNIVNLGKQVKTPRNTASVCSRQPDRNNLMNIQFGQGIFKIYLPIRDTDVVKRMAD